MRIFIALEPEADFLENLSQNIMPLKEKYPHLRWVPEENLHITLVFLGETDKDALHKIFEAVKKACGHKAIYAVSGKTFTLPRGKAPNVLALGFGEGGEAIGKLAAAIEKNLAVCGILSDKDRRKHFLPHITLARKGAEMRVNKEDYSIIAKGVFRKVNVYESTLSSQGAIYTVLGSFPLGAGFEA
ncbi:MAG: RNA 2',3'-cyclic phosphodiesterase [Treponema sp.]|jgi:2'-5' RNA ligase|nr:RNA 2',3'-cyclic phosphodiesterase [Treponema sp.]